MTITAIQIIALQRRTEARARTHAPTTTRAPLPTPIAWTTYDDDELSLAYSLCEPAAPRQRSLRRPGRATSNNNDNATATESRLHGIAAAVSRASFMNSYHPKRTCEAVRREQPQQQPVQQQSVQPCLDEAMPLPRRPRGVTPAPLPAAMPAGGEEVAAAIPCRRRRCPSVYSWVMAAENEVKEKVSE